MASSTDFRIEKLNDSNYQRWKTDMRSLLTVNGLWTCVEGRSDGDPDWTIKNFRALALISLCLSQSQLVYVRKAKSSREAWDKLKNVHEGTGNNKATLYRQLTNMKKTSGESMTQYLNDFTKKCEQLKQAGVETPEELLSIILLNSLPPKYENLIPGHEIPSLETLKSKLRQADAKENPNHRRTEQETPNRTSTASHNRRDTKNRLLDVIERKEKPTTNQKILSGIVTETVRAVDLREVELKLNNQVTLKDVFLISKYSGHQLPVPSVAEGGPGEGGSRLLTAERKSYFMEERHESQAFANGLRPNFQTQQKLFNCLICDDAKIHGVQYKASGSWQKDVLELVHSDVCGPFIISSLGGARYFATFIDDHSRYSRVYMLKSPYEIFQVFRQYKAEVEQETGKFIKRLRTDNRHEYVSETFKTYLAKEGIERELTVNCTPEQNGVAELMNRTLLEMARGILIRGRLEGSLWAELINAANFIRNRCPTKVLNNTTPYEVWHGRKPYVGFFRIIGSRAVLLNEFPNQEYILVGYSDLTYRLWKPGTREVINSRNVVFL